MPPTPKLGSVIKGKRSSYKLEELITEGNMSWALKASDTKNGSVVFLKYYKSPTPTVSWYEQFLQYVETLNKRLEDSAAQQYCVLANDLFTANPKPGMCPTEFFFSTYEFINGGYDMRKLLDSGELEWDLRKKMAKVFLAAMKRIHAAGIVHCDLKPENIQMLPDSSSNMGLLPRMIDMDFSIIEHVQAPWTRGEDKTGYTGTPGYFSPEHLNGTTPTTASDVFTIGIILAELLGGIHPFASANEKGAEEYKKAVFAGNRFMPVQLMGTLGDSEKNADEYAKLIESCFNPTAGKRPTCEQLHRSLLSLDKATSAPQPNPPKDTSEREKTKDTSEREKTKQPIDPPKPPPSTLVLKGDSGSMEFKLSMDLGALTLANISSQSKFCEKSQFRIERKEQDWFVQPISSTTRNLTGVNGSPITGETKLAEGDYICLVGKTSGKTAMKLEVSFK